ncbi:ribonuclease inhibitor-like [Cynoglossus semilaevis]|uniref:ribonuclease inhibitor-like n=1 Tax=Cynoglossus semilaevis TaxID=244447 RepID=UPI000D63167D|nr:ribonuclease inhibitor-like [Cynoglossus semilaevis]
MFHCYTNRRTQVLQDFLGKEYKPSKSKLETIVNTFKVKYDFTMTDFLRKSMEKSLQSRNGHLDLFVRFLHGLCLESNQRILGDLLGQTHYSPETIPKVIENLKKMNTINISPERSINIFHCLTELKDQSVHQQIQEFLKSKTREKELSEIQCSALAYILQMSEEVLDELDLEKYNTSKEGKLRLIPAVRNCRTARFGDCHLSETHWEVVASALKTNPSHMVVLDLSSNLYLEEPGIKKLCSGLESPHCRLDKLKLDNCALPDVRCSLLVSALRSNPSLLTKLDLGGNDVKDLTMENLCGYLESPKCRLETLKLRFSHLSDVSCSSLVSALKSNPSHLRKLTLGGNRLQDSGMKDLCGFLQSPDCKLEDLELKRCELTEISCSSLVSALKSNPFHLKKLAMSSNPLHDSGVEFLCVFLRSPDCRLEDLRLRDCRLSEISCSSLVSALTSNNSRLRKLDLSGNNLEDSAVEDLFGLVDDLMSV